MSSILIKNGSVLTLNEAKQIFNKGYVLIENDLIVDVGAGDPPVEYEKADQILDAANMAVMPGMVNAHTHLFQTFIRGLADDKPLLEWLEAAIWPVAKALTPEEAYVAAMVGLMENIRGGATAVIDHQYIHTDPFNDDGVCQAAEESGVRFLLARGWADMDYHPTFMEDQQRIVSETTRLREKWQVNGNGRIRVEFGPLIPWGCTDDTMCVTHKISKGWGSGTHIHVAETKTRNAVPVILNGWRSWVSLAHTCNLYTVSGWKILNSIWLKSIKPWWCIARSAICIWHPEWHVFRKCWNVA